MIEIAQDRKVVTRIKPFREPRNRHCVIDAWVRASELGPGAPPDILFAALHRSKDGTGVGPDKTGRQGK